jgi:two-component system, cell cycle sensor histidine kinase and response regulator CckA
MSSIPRILIVDDEPQICESLKILLKRQGYDMLTANSGREALELMEMQAFDLLLLDMVIPDMSGFEIMDHVGRCGYDMGIIVITGNASLDSAVTALRKGAFDYLKKPFEYEELLKRVGNALQQKKLARDKELTDMHLARSEERYQMLVQNSPDIIYVLDRHGCFTFVNITVERLLGYRPQQLIGRPFSTLVADDHQELSATLSAQAAQPGGLPRGPVELHLKLCDGGNRVKRFEIEQTPVSFAALAGADPVPGMYGVARDISYRKQLEEQLQQAKKMEAIGNLAGGIAHDFNNILMGIMGYTSLMLEELPADQPLYQRIQSIEQHVRSGASLTRQLLGFARGRQYDVRPVDIHDILDRTADMFGRTKREIVIRRAYQDGVWAVEVDEGQIEQVLLNFYLNAWQAMPGGGTLTITTANRTIDAMCAQQTDLQAGRYVTVRVADTGIGMDEEVRQRIFEPFFSTKGPERGTGLGLASAYSIIANHGGAITVESRKGAGTAFTVFLSATDKPVVKETAVAGEIMPGDETVLLVDDEEAIRDVGLEILEALGYAPVAAGNGDQALDILRQRSGRIDLAIVDLVMPGMNGGALCDRLREVHPGIKLLLSSGYSLDGETASIMERGCHGFIQKPFAIRELSHKLRQILDMQ